MLQTACILSAETVGGIVNGTDIEVTFHYWNKRFGGDGSSGGNSYDYRSNMFCDMYAQSKSGEPLDGIEVYYEGIPENSDYEDGFFDASHTVFDENGEKQYVSGIHRYEWINNTIVSGYAKLRYNKKQEDGTTLQAVPSLFVRGTDPAPPEETPTPPEEKPDVPNPVPPVDEKPDVPPVEEKPIPPEDGGNGITPHCHR